MTDEVRIKLREAAAASWKAFKELREAHLQVVLLDASDGPEGIRIYASEEEGVADWSATFPAVYAEVATQGSSVKLGPFQMRSIYDQLVRQIRPLPQIPIHQHDPFAGFGRSSYLTEEKPFHAEVDFAAVEKYKWVWLMLCVQLKHGGPRVCERIIRELGGSEAFGQDLFEAVDEMFPAKERSPTDVSPGPAIELEEYL